MQYLPENSFPRDHATLMFALAFGFLAAPSQRGMGWGLLVMAAGVAWARVFLGAHYPSDMAGGAVLAFVAVVLVRNISAWQRIWGALERAYERFLRVLHLPEALFPRDL